MIEFQLFRVKVFFPEQMSLLEPPRSRSEILREVIESKPEAQLRRGIQWHIGNVEEVGTNALYFRVGRTTTSTLEFFEDGKFADQLFETAPYTHAVIDLPSEVCVIAKKPQLSHQTTGIANQLARLFEHSETALRLETEFKIGEINDPEDFISQLKSAYLISKFTVWFTQPNPWDVNEDFIRPAQKLVRASNGKQGKTELKGERLNPEVLEDISRSAAATSDDAVAWIKPTATKRRVKKRLKGNPVVLQQEDVDSKDSRQHLVQRMLELYEKVRHSSEEPK
jgi:hypothetical protein